MTKLMPIDHTTLAGPPGDPIAAAILRSLDDPEAFSLVAELVAPRVHRWLRVELGPDGADEVVAEALLEAFRARDRFDPMRGSAVAWFFGISAQAAHRHRRRASRWLRGCERSVEPRHDATEYDVRLLSPDLARALRALPRPQRLVLLLHAVGELAPREVAAALGESEGTIRARLSRARETVATQLPAPVRGGA